MPTITGPAHGLTFYSDYSWNQFPVSISFVLALVFIMAPTRNNRSALPWVTYLVASQSSPITPAPLLLTLEELGYPVDWLYTI